MSPHEWYRLTSKCLSTPEGVLQQMRFRIGGSPYERLSFHKNMPLEGEERAEVGSVVFC